MYPYQWMGRPIKKVALIGGAKSRKHAPISDPTWEIWGLGPRKFTLPRVDRWFEMHSKRQLINHYDIMRGGRFKRHWKFLRNMQRPVYMIKAHKSLPNSVKYPLDAVVNDVGRCFTSSVAYMLGLAIHENFEGIGLWGINMASKKEYLHQLAGVQYLLALARERGIHVYLPNDCPIRIPRKPKLVETPILYGYDWNHPDAWWNTPKRKAKLKKAIKRKLKKAKTKEKNRRKQKVRFKTHLTRTKKKPTQRKRA